MHMIRQHKIVAIARRAAPDKSLDMAQALYDGGIRLIEVTFDQADPDCLSVTPRMIECIAARFDGRMAVGAGTVLTRAQARAAADAGAQFALAPNVDPEVIDEALKRGMMPIPGALTPTVVQYAHALGAAVVKLFPAGDMGLVYMKSLRGPLAHIELLAVGGIHRDNLLDFLNAGAVAVGLASNLVDSKLIDQGRFDELTELARSYTSLL